MMIAGASLACGTFLLLVFVPISQCSSARVDCGTDPVKIVVLDMPPYVFKENDTVTVRSDYVTRPPLQGIIHDFMSNLLQRCLLLCQTPPEVLWKVVQTGDALMDEISGSSSRVSFAFPITPDMIRAVNLDTAVGEKFMEMVNVINADGYYVIASKVTVNEYALDDMLSSLGESWPIFVLTLILAGISGVLIWIMEVFSNKDEFPPSFPRGSYEGFWWAFISMTTVGYGDKTPRSLIGRFFGVIWILFGLVVISMYTATITNAFSSIANPDFNVHEKEVAVIAGDEGSTQATFQGAKPHNYSEFEEAYRALNSSTVAAIFIDKLQGSYYMKQHSNSDLRVVKTVPADLNYKVAYNQSVALPSDFTCVVEGLKTGSVNEFVKKYAPPGREYYSRVDSMSFFSVDSKICRYMLYYLGGTLGGLILIGLVAQVVYAKMRTNKLDFKYSNNESLELKSLDLSAIDRKLQEMSSDINTLRELIAKVERSHAGPPVGVS